MRIEYRKRSSNPFSSIIQVLRGYFQPWDVQSLETSCSLRPILPILGTKSGVDIVTEILLPTQSATFYHDQDRG